MQPRPCLVGDIEVTPLWDGPLPAGLGKIVDDAQRAEAEALVAEAPPDALTMPVWGFLLNAGGRYALIDAGAGTTMSRDLGQLGTALQAQGVSPDKIERIYLTHLHKDHFGGLVDRTGGAAFPQAEIVLHAREAEFWLDTPMQAMPRRAHRYYDLTLKAMALYDGRIRRAGEGERVGDLVPLLAPGHTPGHACWRIVAGGRSMLAWGDVVHVACLHLPAPHIVMEYDLDPATALATRLKILDLVTSQRIPVAGSHLPGPGVGMIVRKGEAYAFEPFG